MDVQRSHQHLEGERNKDWCLNSKENDLWTFKYLINTLKEKEIKIMM